MKRTFIIFPFLRAGIIALFLLLVFTIKGVYAQQLQYNELPEFLKANSVWTFGDSAGLDFNSGSPVGIVTSHSPNSEGTATVADPVTGDLLFYFDAHNCYNAQHQLMSNGTGILGNSESKSQGSLIIPVIDSPGKYYLFNSYAVIDGDPNNPTAATGGFLFYSKIDMSLNGGLGDVVATEKNIILDTDTLHESMIAIPGDNCDIWLLVHKYRVPEFKAYHITSDGINTTPVVSVTGQQLQGEFAYLIGTMAASPNREHIFISSYFPNQSDPMFSTMLGVLLCKFNPPTGTVSDALHFENGLNSFSAAFSPDNSKFYLLSQKFQTPYTLNQYDISLFDSTAIANSKTIIHDFGASFNAAYFRLYRDTIYIATYSPQHNLSTINQPNLSGIACDLQLSSVALAQNTSRSQFLPNEVIHPMPPMPLGRNTDSLVCQLSGGINLYPEISSSAYEYEWDDNSTGTFRQITTPGTYWVHYNDGCRFGTDTFVITSSNIEVIITVDEFVLSTTLSYVTYQWYLNGSLLTGETNSTLHVQVNGDYTVIVTDTNDCTDTSDIYTVTNATDIESITTVAKQITIYPNPSDEIIHINAPIALEINLYDLAGRKLKQIKNAKIISIKDLSPGAYFIHLYNENGLRLKVAKIIKR